MAKKPKEIEAIYEQDSELRVLSFDPASTKMGYSLIQRKKDGIYEVLMSDNIDGRKLNKDKERKAIFKDAGNYTTILAIEKRVEEIVKELKPDVIASESAFVHRLPQAFASLTLVINAIRRAVDTVQNQDIILVAPMQTKKFIAKKANADKDMMKVAVTNHPLITLVKGRNEDYSEHEIDAIGHGVTAIELRVKK